MLLEGKAGKVRLSDGSTSPIRFGKNGALIANAGYPENTQSVLDGDVYFGANLAGTPVTTQAGLSATTPALTLHNPANSGVYLVLSKVNISIAASPVAAVVFSLAYNLSSAAAPTATTDATVISANVGTNKSPSGKCYRICTLPAAPVAFRFLGGTTGALAIGGVVITDEIKGEVIITPGTSVSIQATAAASILASFSWLEIPIV